jgi:hypothetical protein
MFQAEKLQKLVKHNQVMAQRKKESLRLLTNQLKAHLTA